MCTQKTRFLRWVLKSLFCFIRAYHYKFCLHSNEVWSLYPFYYLVYPKEFVRSKKGIRCTKRNLNVLKEFPAHSESVNSAFEAINECETYCSKEKTCWGCSVDCHKQCQWNAIPECGDYDDWLGLIEGDTSVKPGS